MSSPKELRGQVRQVAKELLTEELVKELEKRLVAQMVDRLALISKQTQETLERMDQRARDIQSYVLRNSGGNTGE